jgi:MFS family permease
MRGRTWLINRDYRRLWIGQAISSVGDTAFSATLILWIATIIAKDRSWAPSAVGGVSLAASAAVLLVGPAAGVFVDRWNRRATMLRTEALRALLVGALTALAFLPAGALPTGAWLALIYAVVFGVIAAAMFFNPARFATIAEVVPDPADRARAAGIGQATVATASIIGPPLAAPLLFTIGLQWALLLNAVSYVVSYVAIRSVRASPAPLADPATEPNWQREFVTGLRHLAGSRILVTLLIAIVIATMGTGALNSLDVFFLDENLHSPQRLYGLLSMAEGIGAIVGALSAGWFVARWGSRRTTYLTLVATGLLLVAYARQTQFWGGVVVLTVAAIPAAMVNAATTPLLMAATPSHLLGRVNSVFNPIAQLASISSVFIGTWLASTVLRDFHAEVGGVHFGRVDTIFVASGLLIVAGGGYAAIALPRTPSSGQDSAGSASVTSAQSAPSASTA